ncbi:heparan sulfate 2-O-sulfotransferase 1-like [Lytechinus pictus]|uniref:heparan sulfate 2-O-sulfotransferase 1-like n=1 Tax=Lytechinus pictus TaxID=7653 RepID=UPI0030B9E6A1
MYKDGFEDSPGSDNTEDKQLRDALDNGHMRHLQKVPTPLVADELFQQRPMYPLIIYNRVPKTGSTSLTSLPYTLCETLRYHVLHICTVEHTQVLSVQDQIGIVRNISSWSVKQPGFFHGHFAYLDFPRFGSHINPIYINMVRSPLDRFISYYYFLRHGDNFRPSLSRHRARSNEQKAEDEGLYTDLPHIAVYCVALSEIGIGGALYQNK